MMTEEQWEKLWEPVHQAQAYRDKYPVLPSVYHKPDGTTVTVYQDGLRITILHKDWSFAGIESDTAKALRETLLKTIYHLEIR